MFNLCLVSYRFLNFILIIIIYNSDMLRKKLGKQLKQVKPTTTSTTSNTQKPITINLGKGMAIDKEKISQIAIAKERQQKKQKQLINKLSQGQSKHTKQYFSQYSGKYIYAFSGNPGRKGQKKWDLTLKEKNDQERFSPKNYL